MLFITAFLPPSSLKEGMLPAQQPDVTCKMVWNTITSQNRSHIPCQHLQWLIKYLSDHLNISTGPSITTLPEFTYCNLKWKRQASCKQLESQIAEDPILAWFLVLKVEFLTLLLESKILWEMDAAAFQGIVGKSFYLLPSCHRWSQYFDADRGGDLSCTGVYARETRELLPWWRVKAAQLEAPHQALLNSVGARGSNGNYLSMTQHLWTGTPGPSHTGSFSVADESNSHGLWR